MDYRSRYLKYKAKYLSLRGTIVGGNRDTIRRTKSIGAIGNPLKAHAVDINLDVNSAIEGSASILTRPKTDTREYQVGSTDTRSKADSKVDQIISDLRENQYFVQNAEKRIVPFVMAVARFKSWGTNSEKIKKKNLYYEMSDYYNDKLREFMAYTELFDSNVSTIKSFDERRCTGNLETDEGHVYEFSLLPVSMYTPSIEMMVWIFSANAMKNLQKTLDRSVLGRLAKLEKKVLQLKELKMDNLDQSAVKIPNDKIFQIEEIFFAMILSYLSGGIGFVKFNPYGDNSTIIYNIILSAKRIK